jgi:hypothetical protein
MAAYDDFPIAVMTDWNDWRSANVRFRDLQDIHWHQPVRAPQPLIHAFVSCADLISGTLPHACDSGTAPHRVHVCVLRTHTIPPVHDELARRADAAPAARAPTTGGSGMVSGPPAQA